MIGLQRFFILGNPRSGTSLFRLMLNAHNNIICPPECGFMHWWWSKYHNWTTEDCQSIRVDEFLNDLYSSKKIETWYLDKGKLQSLIARLKPKNYFELSSVVYLSYAPNKYHVKMIGDKNNYYIDYIHDLIEIWPNAYYFHLVRDGRDVFCSYREVNTLASYSKYKPKVTNDIEIAAREWIINNSKIEQLKEKFPDSYFRIKYENLVRHTKCELNRLCDFVGIPFDSNMLEYFNLRDTTSVEPKETLDWKQKTLEEPDLSKIGRFKNELSQNEIHVFAEIAGSYLREYGYE